MASSANKNFIELIKVSQTNGFEFIWELNIREINYFWWRLNLREKQNPYKFWKNINNNFYLINTNDIYLQVIAKLREIQKKEDNDTVKNLVEEFVLHKSSYLVPNEHCTWFLNNLRAALWLGHNIFNERGDIFKAVGKDDYMNQLIRLIDMHALWLNTDIRISDLLKDFSQKPSYTHQVSKINSLKYQWFSIKIPNIEVRWLDIKDAEQLDDAIAYLASKNKLVLQNHFIANNNEEKMAHILASLDYINFFSSTSDTDLLQPYTQKEIYSKPTETTKSEDSDDEADKQKSSTLSDPISIRNKFINTFKKKYTMQSYRINQKQSKDQQSVKLSKSSYTALQTLGKAQGLTPRKMVEALLQLYMGDLKNDNLKIKNSEQNDDAALSIDVQIDTITSVETSSSTSVETSSSRLEKNIDKKKIEIANLEQDENSLNGLNEKEEAVVAEEIHSISLKNATNKSELETVHKKVYDVVIENIIEEKENLTLEKSTDPVTDVKANKNKGLKTALLNFKRSSVNKK